VRCLHRLRHGLTRYCSTSETGPPSMRVKSIMNINLLHWFIIWTQSIPLSWRNYNESGKIKTLLRKLYWGLVCWGSYSVFRNKVELWSRLKKCSLLRGSENRAEVCVNWNCLKIVQLTNVWLIKWSNNGWEKLTEFVQIINQLTVFKIIQLTGWFSNKTENKVHKLQKQNSFWVSRLFFFKLLSDFFT